MFSSIRRYLPSALTLLNLGLGIFAMAFLLRGEVRSASFLVLAGMFFDGLDGKLARMLDVTSSFGKELDSLADVITFGAAPALIILSLSPESVLHQLSALLFVSAGAIRLARFNTQPSTGAVHFVGLPITAGGGIAATMVLYADRLPGFLLPVAHLVLAGLMVSKVPYLSLKSVRLPRNIYVLMASLTATAAAIWLARDWVFIPLIGYALFGISYRGELWRRLPHHWRVRYEKSRNRRLAHRLAKRQKGKHREDKV